MSQLPLRLSGFRFLLLSSRMVVPLTSVSAPFRKRIMLSFVSFLVAFSAAAAFDMHGKRQHRHGHQYPAVPSSSSSPVRRHDVAPNFDFSSTQAWEDYYQTTDATAEWHSSVPMETLARLVPLEATSVVLVGCGSSVLPQYIQNFRPRAGLILQDSSQTCLQMLHQRYGSSVSYVCGDATKLSECILDSVDVIYDKGLMDVIFCNEGWDRPIALLLQQASNVLVEGGVYILVSYRLPTSTKEFLSDVGNENNLEWSFDKEGSNDRVGISVATKRTLPLIQP